MLCVRFERRSKSDDRGNARCAQQRQGGCRTSTMAAFAARLNASFTRSTPPLVPPPTMRLGPLQNSEETFSMAFWVLAGSPFSAKVSTFLVSHTAAPCSSWRTSTSTVLIPEILICSVTTKLRDFIFRGELFRLNFVAKTSGNIQFKIRQRLRVDFDDALFGINNSHRPTLYLATKT